MSLEDKITMMYKQYYSTKKKKTKKELYKAIKRAEGERRRAKLGGTIIV